MTSVSLDNIFLKCSLTNILAYKWTRYIQFLYFMVNPYRTEFDLRPNEILGNLAVLCSFLAIQ